MLRVGFRRRVAAVFLVTGLGACAGPLPGRHSPQSEISGYVVDGRFSLQQSGRTYAGRISWTHSPGADRVMIADPFGSGIAELDRRPEMTRLTFADGRVSEDADPAALMQRLTGMSLPVDRVGKWLTGRPVGGEGGGANAEIDALGRTVAIDREGWKIRFEYAEDLADALPAKVFARRSDELELRLSVERWEPAQ